MTAYRFTTNARDGLARVLEFVEVRFGADVADEVLGDLEAAFALLASNPDAGHRRDDITANARVRFWPVGPTLVAYRRHVEGIEILFVERGSLDWQRLMEE